MMQIFAEIQYLYKYLRTAMTPNQDFWDTIVIVIALDFLHQDFDITTASLLETGDKTINKIQSIIQSKKAKNLSKRATGNTGKLAIAFRGKGAPGKRKNTNEDECYNCHKFRHFRQDCFFSDRRLNRTTQQLQSRKNNLRKENSYRNGAQHQSQSGRRSDTLYRAHQTSENKMRHKNNSDFEPFAPGPVGTVFMVKKQQDGLGL